MEISEKHRLGEKGKKLGVRARAFMEQFVVQGVTDLTAGSADPLGDAENMLRWLQHGSSVGTVTAYESAFARMTRWAEERKLLAFPTTPYVVARYLTALADHCKEKGLTKANVNMAFAAINWAHKQAGREGLDNPCSHPLVRNLRSAIGKGLGARGVQKAPITGEIMQQLYDKFIGGAGGGTLGDLLMMMRLAMMKDGLMRWDDIKRVLFGDIIFTESHARVFVHEAKTDTYRLGQWVVLYRHDALWAAYTLLTEAGERLGEAWRALPPPAQARLRAAHEGLTLVKQGREELRLDGVRVMATLQQVGGAPKGCGMLARGEQCVGYASFVAMEKSWVAAIGLDPTEYATHSCRRGGATDQRAAGVPEELVMDNGRWRSRKTMMTYFDLDVEFTLRAKRMAETRQGWELRQQRDAREVARAHLDVEEIPEELLQELEEAEGAAED